MASLNEVRSCENMKSVFPKSAGRTESMATSYITKYFLVWMSNSDTFRAIRWVNCNVDHSWLLGFLTQSKIVSSMQAKNVQEQDR